MTPPAGHPVSDWIRGTLVSLLLIPSAVAQEAEAPRQTPDDLMNEQCGHSLHAGLTSSHGNRDSIAAAVGVDLCHDRKSSRWEVESDANVVRNLDAEGNQSLLERWEVESAYRRVFLNDWHWGVIGVGQADDAGTLQSRLFAGTGMGVTKNRDWGTFMLEGGVAQTWEDTEGMPVDEFTESWFRGTLRRNFRKNAVVMQKLEWFARVSDLNDHRADSETDLMLRFDNRLALKTTLEIKWDGDPRPGVDAVDISTQMALVFSWGQ